METLMNNHPNFYAWQHLEQNQEPLTSWSPRVDVESPVGFMPQEPLDIMTTGGFQHLPWIVGITDDEGARYGVISAAGLNSLHSAAEATLPLFKCRRS